MSQAHARHAGARSAYRATRRVDTAGAWRTSNRRRPQASDTRHGYEPSPAPMAAYRSEYTRRHPQRRQARASYGGAGQYHRHRRYAVRTQSHAATTPVDRQRRDHTPSRYRVPGDRTRVPTARTSARHAAYARTGSPYHLHGGFVRRTVSRRTNPVRLTGAGRQVGTGATGGRRVFRGTAPTRYAAARAHAVPAQPAKVRVRRGPGLRDRLGHATTMMASNAAQAGIDRADIADTMGHTAMELTARTSMAAGATAAHAVGHVAGRARAVMTRPKRAMVAAYKAEEKTARQLDRALRKGKPGAARAKRIADARKHAGKPLVLSDAKPSARIGGFAAKGKASRMIGKHVGGGLKKAGRGVKRIGTTGLDWMDEASARLTAADDDPASQLGAATRDLTFKAARKGVKGVNSSARFIWRHRRAPAKAVRGAKAVGTTGARVARAAVNLVRAAASRIAAGAASISLPIMPVIAAMLAVLGVLLAVMGAFLGSSASESTVSGVPAEYEADVIRAGSICQVVTPSIIAAQIDQESNWNPKAGSSAGAQGIAQFMPSTWASAGKDGDGDGKADIWNPHDAIWSQGNYMCNLASQVETAKKSGKLTGDTLELTLAAYNAGLGSVLRYGMVPPFEETINYVRRIKELAATKYTATGTAEGGTVGSLEPKLTVSGGIVSTAGITPDTRYPWGQCTWWAATRRADIGKPIPGWGNAATWAGSAASAGYTVDGSPSAGSVIVFQPGVLGASADYGHVAMVEEVRGDGSILISESNALGLGVVSTREISASQLAAAGSGIRYIH
ncbi:glycoside hydrolase [Bifidobacterium longum]|nr:glycoside hydrolase [Bifidobacterium longum]